MTFDKLADRCLLFVDTEKNLLIELLKEAEIEMSRKCNIFENSRGYYTLGTNNIFQLPSDYKQMILAKWKNYKLLPIHEDEVDYDTDGNIKSGTPSGYFIRNNDLHLNYIPELSTTVKRLNISYYGVVDNTQPLTTVDDVFVVEEPMIPDAYHRDLCDYAIAIAAAKSLPDLHTKHWNMWNSNLLNIQNEDADRELVHSIKEDI